MFRLPDPSAAVVALSLVCLTAATGCSEPKGDDSDAGRDGESSVPFTGTARGDERYTFALVQMEEDAANVSDVANEYDEASCPSDCTANAAPVIGPAFFVLNGVREDDVSPTASDDLAIFVPFADAECNLACGARSDSFSEPEDVADGIQSLPSNLPCSSDESETYFRVSPGGSVFVAGSYSYSVWLEDACGERSDTVSVQFNVE